MYGELRWLKMQIKGSSERDKLYIIIRVDLPRLQCEGISPWPRKADVVSYPVSTCMDERQSQWLLWTRSIGDLMNSPTSFIRSQSQSRTLWCLMSQISGLQLQHCCRPYRHLFVAIGPSMGQVQNHSCLFQDGFKAEVQINQIQISWRVAYIIFIDRKQQFTLHVIIHELI